MKNGSGTSSTIVQQKNSCMYTVMEKYCRDKNANAGLFLLDMATGHGKTHNVLNLIFDLAHDPTFDRKKIVFCTTLLKNLPEDELRKRFADCGEEKLFEQKYIKLESYKDMLMHNMTDAVIGMIPSDIQKLLEFKQVRNAISFLKSSAALNNPQARKGTEDLLRDEYEPNFRRTVKRLFKKAFRKEPAVVKRNILKSDFEWKWVGKLYPSIFLCEKQIIMLSVKKFLLQNDDFVSPSTALYSSDMMRSAIIFIDEFDATKDTVLDTIIENSLKDKVDFIGIFKDIYAGLTHTQLQRILLESSQKRLESQYAEKKPGDLVELARVSAEKIYKEYSLQFNLKTEADGEEKNNFMFQDHSFVNILDRNKRYANVISCADEHVNSIYFSDRKGVGEGEYQIDKLLSRVEGFIIYFCNLVRILADNYCQVKNERKRDNQDDFTYEEAVNTVLDAFNISEENQTYLVRRVLTCTPAKREIEANAQFDLSFYENGFRYFSFEDSSLHDMKSKIMQVAFDTTPEKILLKLCNSAKVIGISATATIPSVIGNYDLDYIKAKLANRFVMPTKEECYQLREEFEKGNKGYVDEIQAVTEIFPQLDENQYSSAEEWRLWAPVFKAKDEVETEEYAQEAHNYILRKIGGNKNGNLYNVKRYLRVCLAYRRFLENQDIRSFLCIMNRHVKPNASYNKEDLGKLLNMVRAVLGIQGDVYDSDCRVEILAGDGFDDTKKRVLKDLADGKKIFVLTAYQTVGVGQNLQYKIPDEIKSEIVPSNDFPARAEKDFDAIYLDKPTNVIVNTSQPFHDNGFEEYLWQTMFLYEGDEISRNEMIGYIRNAFRHFATGTSKPSGESTEQLCRSTRLSSTRMIIQAIGRICRTNQKQKKVYIFAEHDIRDALDLDICSGRLLNPEFLSLIDAVKKMESKNVQCADIVCRADRISERANRFIHRKFLNGSWTPSSMEQWEKMREYVLTHPTLATDDCSNNEFGRNMYVNFPGVGKQLYYSQENDFSNISISFESDVAHFREVSEQEARLDRLMTSYDFRSFFDENGYATEFARNDRIMCPPIYNNIYKGALGEVLGKHIFEKYAGLSVEKITDPAIFELFDYKIGNTKVFVDFKHWKPTYAVDAGEYLQKIKDKAIACGAECVIIANLLLDRIYKQYKNVRLNTTTDGLKILVVPALVLDRSDVVEVNSKAVMAVRKCVDEYSS